MNDELMQKRILSLWLNEKKKPEGIELRHFSGSSLSLGELFEAGVYHPTQMQLEACRLSVADFLDIAEMTVSDYNDTLKSQFIRTHLKGEKLRELREISQRLMDDSDGCTDIIKVDDTSEIYHGESLVNAYKAELSQEYKEIDFGMLRHQLQGVMPGDVVNIAGRSGTGKTALLLMLMGGVWRTAQTKSMFFSIEMKLGQIAKRMHDISYYARNDCEDVELVREGCWNSWLETRRTQKFEKLAPPWMVVTDVGFHIDQMENKINGAKKKGHNVGIIGIDYLQLLEGSGKDRRVEVSYIARRLKQIAKRCNVIILSLCQTSRAGEDGTKPVQINHLKESGDIEEASDVIIGLWKGTSDDHVWVSDIKNRSAGQHPPQALHRCGVYFRECREGERYIPAGVQGEKNAH
jgi:KaiC/GvpD/RAD55 family RecA-like ATPase